MAKKQVVIWKDGKRIVIENPDFTSKEPPDWFKEILKENKDDADESSTNK